MTTNDTTSQTGPQPGAATGRLTRSRDDRVIAGVCGGLGRYARVDPVIFRIVLVVLAFFGGVGLLLYVIGWLFLAEDGDTASPVEALFGRGRSSTNAAIAVLLLVVAVAALGFGVWGNHLALLALVVIAGLLLVRHTTSRDDTRPGDGPPPGAAGSTPASEPYAPHGPYARADYAAGTEPPLYGQPSTPYQQTAVFQTPPAAPRERSVLGRVVLSVAALVAAGLLVADLSGAASVSPGGIVASVLAVVAVGLLVGTVYGRARWLAAIALALTLALSGLSVSRHVGDRIDAVAASRSWTPVSAAALQPAYEIGAGTARLDLRKVNFSGRSEQVTVHVGAGDVTVLVPRTVDVTAHGSVGLGQVRLFGHQPVGGAGSKDTARDFGPDGPGGGQLRLYADAGIGAVRVVRR